MVYYKRLFAIRIFSG